jgi:hypothetical protein
MANMTPAPKTEKEFQHLLNDFMRWVTVFEVEVEAGRWECRGVSPERWPPHWWTNCECHER